MSAGAGSEFHVVFPLWGPVGGVIKILDYLHHTVDIGFERAVAWGPPRPGPDAPIRDHAAYRRALDDDRIRFGLLRDLELPPSAWVLFSEPSQHPDIERALPPGSDRRRIIHLVQNTRHANPRWHLGFPYLLLHRPVTRVFVTDEVAAAVRTVANDRYPSTTILEGHDWEYFSRTDVERTSGPLRVGYTTWKSTIGEDVAAALAGDDRFRFEAIRAPASWSELRGLYHRSDVWLCAPGPEEGFYLPGIEAMAAECSVVSALIGGNRSYLQPEVNCIEARFEDVATHVTALERLHADADLREQLRRGGHATTARHTLGRERDEFGDFVAMLSQLA